MKNVHAGFVGVDCDGTVAMPFNTPGMFRATLHETDSAPQVYIFIWVILIARLGDDLMDSVFSKDVR